MTSSENVQSSSDRSSTAERILDCAQERIQRCGYNAVSYGDLADDLDLTTAAIHYHFPSRGDLGQALVARYRRSSAEKRAVICDDTVDLRDRLTRYAELYAEMLEEGGRCLSGILAADASTLPDAVQHEVQQFFRDQEDWLTEVIAADTTDGGGLEGAATARDVAELTISVLQGAMLTAPDRDVDTYTRRVHVLIDSVVT
ncbi:MAG: TetR/AcrR family transcriptional regulator [Bacteroidetes bacterium SW_9_63_38]|nr:MAG: TetR/AcrR family transcriptional regulator [Bacteroidetes bacterium SW_9_63_38]